MRRALRPGRQTQARALPGLHDPRLAETPVIREQTAMAATVRVNRHWLALGALPLASGAALIVYVLTRISLGLALVGAVALVVAGGRLSWSRLSRPARVVVARRLRAGLAAGLLATAAYDATRWVTVTFFHDTFSPFDIFPVFGHAIAGTALPLPLATAIGVLYHYANGTSFAVAYAILLAPRGWWTGVLWALGLEALMLSIYPGWLHPHPFAEFLSVSMLGHVAYGSVLGTLSKRLQVRGRAPVGTRAVGAVAATGEK